MDFRKIVIVSVVALAIFASMSVVSAGFLDGLFGGEDKNVTIGGEQFTIPSDFDENLELSYNKSYNGINDSTVHYDKFGGYIEISVKEYKDIDGIDASLKGFSGAVNKTISNKTGTFIKQGDECNFNYIKENKLISISTTDESYLEQVIV